VALAENKAREIGLACFNVSLSQLLFCQYSDTSSFALTLAQLHMYSPKEVLVPHTTAHSQLVSMLRERFAASCNVVEVNRKFFNEATGVTCLQALSSTPLTLDRIDSKVLRFGCVLVWETESVQYLSLAAAAAVVKYVEYIQQTSFANASLKITYRALEGEPFCGLSDFGVQFGLTGRMKGSSTWTPRRSVIWSWFVICAPVTPRFVWNGESGTVL
jgi:DNA mismatch repair ATPase MutS